MKAYLCKEDTDEKMPSEPALDTIHEEDPNLSGFSDKFDFCIFSWALYQLALILI